MSCWSCMVPEQWQTSVGCKPTGCNENVATDNEWGKYPANPSMDPHRRSPGLIGMLPIGLKFQ